MAGATAFDIAFIGHYTKDTIVAKAGTRLVNGGAYFYGSSAARHMGLKTAAVTRLAREDFPSFAPLTDCGVMVRAIPSEHSTCLKLDYPTDNPDDRILSVTMTASPFEPADIPSIQAGVWSVGASLRGEVSLEVLKTIKASGAKIGLDAQGYVRVIRDGTLAYDRNWPEKAAVLGLVDVFKADVVEAEILTGYRDLRKAAAELLKNGDMELVLTHGAGVLVWAGGTFYEAPFTARSQIGRSGRGDTCLASYLAARISMKPREATRWAAALTSLKMETAGPFSGTRADVEKALRERY
ncbi:MAG: PfkB family carbohydrate kinase [Spirochaetes bacterium]|nr:PfkB family carbohydrate kinase [Spirochaetota bacterium]